MLFQIVEVDRSFDSAISTLSIQAQIFVFVCVLDPNRLQLVGRVQSRESFFEATIVGTGFSHNCIFVRCYFGSRVLLIPWCIFMHTAPQCTSAFLVG